MRIDAGLIIGVALEFIIMLEKELLYKLCDVLCGVFDCICFFAV